VLVRLRILRKNPLVDLLVTLVTAVVIAYLVQLFVVKPFRVPSESMEPTLMAGDRIIAVRFLLHFRDPQRGEILVFHPNGHGNDVFRSQTVADPYYVKRLIGLPGETVGSHNGRVWICSQSAPTNLAQPQTTPGCRYLNEPYTHGLPTYSLVNYGQDLEPTRLGPDQYFMMGDNRTNSADSREWGAIRRTQIVGQAFMTYWPISRISFY
jgi:signal peptidase I